MFLENDTSLVCSNCQIVLSSTLTWSLSEGIKLKVLVSVRMKYPRIHSGQYKGRFCWGHIHNFNQEDPFYLCFKHK